MDTLLRMRKWSLSFELDFLRCRFLNYWNLLFGKFYAIRGHTPKIRHFEILPTHHPPSTTHIVAWVPGPGGGGTKKMYNNTK